MFSADNGEFIEVSIESNPARLSAKDWYLTKSPGVSVSQITTVTNWEGTLSGIKGADQLTVYYTRSDKVYLIHYNTTILSEASFKTTFEMMYKSFRPAIIQNTNTNTNTTTNTNLNTNTSSGVNVNILFNTNSTTNTNLNTNSNSNSNSNLNVNTNTNNNTNTNLNSSSSNRL